MAEPVHSTGYLPLYIAIANGYFDDAGVSVKLITIETGAGHTNAVLSGDAFAFIGGPEHNAFAKLRGGELRAIVNCVDRNNNYLSAATGLAPAGTATPSPSCASRSGWAAAPPRTGPSWGSRTMPSASPRWRSSGWRRCEHTRRGIRLARHIRRMKSGMEVLLR